MIDITEDGWIKENKLTEIEKKIFIQFLKHEKNRHLEDIIMINKTIAKLK